MMSVYGRVPAKNIFFFGDEYYYTYFELYVLQIQQKQSWLHFLVSFPFTIVHLYINVRFDIRSYSWFTVK